MRFRLLPVFMGFIPMLVVATPAFSDEGMWPFDNVPAQTIKSKYGVTIDQGWLDHVRGSAVRLSSGCSASLVSREGLVLTNHHCVARCVQDLSTPTVNYTKEGFSIQRREEDRSCPGMQGEILESISDVTPKIAAATSGKTGQEFVRARDSAFAQLEKEGCSTRETTHRCSLISFYQGGQYKLYIYRKYPDVRLVFAPEQQMAFFGGDPDNFNFPRYDLDFSFVRLYEKGRPAATPTHLTWNTDPPKDGEPVFVAGNPGSTDRLRTVAQLASIRDVANFDWLLQYSELRGRFIRFAQESAEHARFVGFDLFSLENSLKAIRGEQLALMDPRLLTAKRQAEAELKAAVAADRKLAAEIGDPWGDIERVQTDRAALYPSVALLERRAGFQSDLFGYARQLVRAAQERPKPNTERLPEYTDARLPLLEKNMLDPNPVHQGLEQLKLEFWLTKVREYLTADAEETNLLLGRDSPEQLARVLATSKLSDPAVRKRLWEGGLSAVQASDDPLIRFVLKMDSAARALRKSYDERVEGPTGRAAERVAKARFAILGTAIYPDATSSLRLSYGAIAGWTERGRQVPAFTKVAGLFQRATGQPPYDLPARWANAQDKLDPQTTFNISTTNDIIGGNSGSPLMNARGEVIGAIFDGNIHSLGGRFYYDPALNRSVSVSTAAITEALRKIYGQQALVRELTTH
jgi:hypothetical protein